jgi:alpha-L-arabinofuranosidase
MPTVTVFADQPGRSISPLLHGIFFEDINFAADGGLHPQLVKNGSFEFSPDPLMGWRKIERGGSTGSLSVLSQNPLNENNPHYLQLAIYDPGDGFGLVNEGFRGMGVRRGMKYVFSVYVRSDDIQPIALRIELLAQNNRHIASATLEGFSRQWKKYSCVIESSADEEKAQLLVFCTMQGSLDLDAISLLPRDAPLFRPDLLQLLKDLNPQFLRFPGGCIVEGRVLSNRYQWKKTIGELSERPVIMNRWNTEFKHRPSADYFQSCGLGFCE